MQVKTTPKARPQMTYFEAMEKIVELAKNAQLSKEFFRKVKRYTSFLSAELELDPETCVLLSLLVNKSEDNSIKLEDLAKYVDCSTIRILRMQQHLDILIEWEWVYYIKYPGWGNPSYRVPRELLEALRVNKPYQGPKVKGLNLEEWLSELDRLFNLRDKGEILTDALIDRLNHLLCENKQLEVCRRLVNILEGGVKLRHKEFLVLLYLIHRLVNENGDFTDIDSLESLFDKGYLRKIFILNLKGGETALFELGLIEHAFSSGFGNNDEISLTRTAKTELLAGVYTPKPELGGAHGLITTEQIEAKELFYPKELTKQVDDLVDLLQEANYMSVQQRLKEQGFRCGLTCLFYGAPGTGKTETVLQLARRTGRDIMQVNMAELKDKWVGESEKAVKGIFSTYKNFAHRAKRMPILLFNEADAIIGKRMEGAGSEGAVQKMENSLQNILLQEMETLDGILIATTNLTKNMDKAFERRFLYKMQFTEPTVQARQSIWATMIPALSPEESRELAHTYTFSGGQIENIARLYTIDNILHQGAKETRLEQIHRHCKAERIEQQQGHRVGF